MTTTRSLMSTLFTLCVLLTPSAAGAFDVEAGDHSLSIGGFIDLGGGARVANPDSFFITSTLVPEEDQKRWLMQQNQLRLEVGGSHPGDVLTQLNVDLLYTSSPGRPFDDRFEVEIDEAYIDFRTGGVDWRLGKEKVIWGKADLVSRFDLLSSRDLKDPFVNDGIETRQGQWGVRTSLSGSDSNFEVVFHPVWNRSRSPEASTGVLEDGRIGDTEVDAWFPPIGIASTVGIITGNARFPRFLFLPIYHRTEFPDEDLETATFGARLNLIQGSWDTELYYVTAIDPAAHPEVEASFFEFTDPGMPTTLQLEIHNFVRHTRLHTFGAGTATTVGRFALRGELSATEGKVWYRLPQQEEVDGLIAELLESSPTGATSDEIPLTSTVDEHWDVSGMFGIDVELPGTGITTSNQIAVTYGLDHRDVYFQDRIGVSFTNVMRKSWLDEHVTFTWANMVNFTGTAVSMHPKLAYTPPTYEDLLLQVGMNLFVGGSTSLLGQYDEHSTVTLSARVYF